MEPLPKLSNPVLFIYSRNGDLLCAFKAPNTFVGKVFSSSAVYLTLAKFDQQMEAKEQVKKVRKLLLLGFPELSRSVGWKHGKAVQP